MAAIWQAQGLMFLSAFLASLGSLDISALVKNEHYCHWTQLLLCNGVVGCGLCGSYWFIESFRLKRTSFSGCIGTFGLKYEPRSSLFGKKENLPWLIARGLSGGIAMTCAWVAMSYINMAQANVIMFTNPVWTGVIAWLVLGQSWRWYDKVLCALALVCVVIVARPPLIFGHEHSTLSVITHSTLSGFAGFLTGPHPGPASYTPDAFSITPLAHWVGIGAAFLFAIFLSIASLIINTKLKGKEKPNTVSLYLFMGVIICDLPFLFTLAKPQNLLSVNFDRPQIYMFLGVGAIFYGFQFLRSWALLISNSASVVNMLYAEIALAFLWGKIILHQPFFWTSMAAALAIIVGCLLVSWLKCRSTEAGLVRQVEAPVVIAESSSSGIDVCGPSTNKLTMSHSGDDESTAPSDSNSEGCSPESAV